MAAEAAARRQPSRLVLLVQNRAGYLNCCELLARLAATGAAARRGDRVAVARPSATPD